MSKASIYLTGLRDHNDEELRTALAEKRDELFRLKLGQHTNQVTSSALLTTRRREIAQILTVLNGRKQGIETQAQRSSTPASKKA